MACHCRHLSRLFKVIELPRYIKNTANDYYNALLNEFNQRNFYKRQGRPPYLSSMIWYALHLHYTLLQAYRLLIEKSPMLSLSLLNNIKQGGVDTLKAFKTLYEKAPFLVTVFG